MRDPSREKKVFRTLVQRLEGADHAILGLDNIVEWLQGRGD